MGLINTHKEESLTRQSLFLFDITLPNGTVKRVCTHKVTYGGNAYEPRVLGGSIDPLQALSPDGIEVPASVRLTLADADLALSALDRSVGWKGARIVARWAFYDFDTEAWSSDSIVPYVGRVDDPELRFGDGTIAISTSYILNLQAKQLPGFLLQQRCPKLFPATAAQKTAAANPRSIFHPCGVTDPTKTDCDYTPAACAANGVPLRFAGHPYSVPPASAGHEYVTGKWINDLVSNPNAGQYGQPIPFGYGTAWVDAISLGEWPEPNSTRGEAIVCEGRPEAILKVVVEDTELPAANSLDGSTYIVKDVLLRYNVIATGDRDGALNADAPWNSQGDPHGSQCVIEWVLPRRLTGTPRIRVLVKFPKVLHYQRIETIVGGVVTFADNTPNFDVAGNSPFVVAISGNTNGALNGTFGLTSWSQGPPGTVTLDGTTDSGDGGYLTYMGSSDNPAWASLDALQRSGLADADAWIDEFVRTSNHFSERVDYVARDGTTQQHARHVCSMVIQQQRSAAEILTGLMRGCNAHLVRDVATGAVGLKFRGTIAQQQPTTPDGSNYTTTINGGKVAYHFDEASMLRREDGKSSLRKAARAAGSIPNSVTVPFANEENEYSGDSVRTVDTDDINLMGQEIGAGIRVDGVASVDRAHRIGAVCLAEMIEGEPWEWETTHKAVKLQVGQIVATSSVEADFDHQLMRVQRIEPAMNWESARIVATIHDDDWYADTVQPKNESITPRRDRLRRPSFGWAPYQVQPASGDPVYARTEWTFGLSLRYDATRSGTPKPVALITGRQAVNEPVNLLPPVLGYQGTTSNSGGSLAGSGAVYFVGLSSKDSDGRPGPMSKLCQVAVSQSGTSNKITIPVNFLDPAGDGYYVFAGRHPERLAATNDAGYAGSPTSIDVTSIPEATWGAPDTEYDATSVRPRLVAHYGPFASGVSAVGTGTLEIAGAGWTVNEWAGYDCSILAKGDGSELPVLNFRVVSNTADTLTVTPDPDVLGVEAGDLLGMLSKPAVAGLVMTDAQWANSLSGGGLGLAAHAEKGRVARAIAGTGRGHRYVISDNDATSITLAGPWITAWDSTTRYVIEEAAELPTIDSSAPGNSDETAVMTLEAAVDNYAGRVVLLEVATRDGGGNESSPTVNPVRMIYVAGAQGTREVTADDTQLTTDGLLLFDATTADITFQCLSYAEVPNQTITARKIDSSAHTVTLQAATGELFSNGASTIVLAIQGDSTTVRFDGA